MLIGKASTVTIVSVKRLAIGLLADLGRDFFLQQLDALLQLEDVVDHEIEFFGGLAQLVEVGLGDPGRWRPQEAEQGSGLGRQQAAQAHQHAAQLAQIFALAQQPAQQQLVFDGIDAEGRFAGDAHQRIALGAHEVVQEGDRRIEATAVLDRLAQAIDRAQRMDAGR